MNMKKIKFRNGCPEISKNLNRKLKWPELNRTELNPHIAIRKYIPSGITINSLHIDISGKNLNQMSG